MFFGEIMKKRITLIGSKIAKLEMNLYIMEYWKIANHADSKKSVMTDWWWERDIKSSV